ncbi:hypothetical protein NHX12_008582 [Muraenolepis orangiensis]|uniref:Phospholipase A2 n=1 Tax=Muraenolepis orangiensis TaxID=630683 RepID=A0A9Q0DLS8_9TELE|nr:hypothetical protein NHX12_008582 [Muraenolepis orangiensis]
MASGNVFHFGRMILCVQPWTNPLHYNNYGCWCGFGGRAEPVDDMDMCCKLHDMCYKTCKLTPGCSSLIHFRGYRFTCDNRQATCSASNNNCQAALCECDRVAAHCFARTEYNPENKKLNKRVHCVD